MSSVACGEGLSAWRWALGSLVVAMLGCNGVVATEVSGTAETESSELEASVGEPSAVKLTEQSRAPEVEQLEVNVIRELPHHARAYTQGLLIHEGLVYESRGQYGRSGLDVWQPADGTVVRSVDLEQDLFGEGLARVGEALWQLTWQSGKALNWSLDLERIGERSFSGEGWGLEFDGERLILSDGTHELRFYDPGSFEYLGKLAVMRGNRPQDQLNELEFIAESRELFANVYQSDEIVRIELDTGYVTGSATLTGLLSGEEARRADVLNGIAYWPERDSFLVTGKHWPKSFEVKFE